MANVQLKDSTGEPIYPVIGRLGETWITIDGSTPPGGIPYDGQVITNGKVIYKDLWNLIKSNNRWITENEWNSTANQQDGDCNKYADLEGNSFRMPRITHWLKPDDSNSTSYLRETLPNIKGQFTMDSNYAGFRQYAERTGCFETGSYCSHSVDFNNVSGYGVAFNAALGEQSRDSKNYSVYKNNACVRPNTNVIRMGVYATDVVRGLGSVEANDIMNKLTAMDSKFNNMGIVEFGDRYIRFGNGVQICWDSISLDSSGSGTWSGNIYYANVKGFSAYEKPFINNAKLACLAAVTSGSSAWISKTSTNCNSMVYIELCRPDSTFNDTTFGISYITIGRWK